VICVFQGATGGTIAIATAVVATGSPRHRVGRALGILSSAVALGSVVGPAFGAWAARAIGIRSAFTAAGLIILAALVPIAFFVRNREAVSAEHPERSSQGYRLTLLRPIAWVIVCQLLMQSSYTGAMLLVVVRIVQIVPSGTALMVSATYSLVGLAAAAAAIARVRPWGSHWLSTFRHRGGGRSVRWDPVKRGRELDRAGGRSGRDRAGFRRSWPSSRQPCGIAAPANAYARACALNSSAMALGYGAGPLMSGSAGVAFGIVPAQLAAGGVALLLTIVLATMVQGKERVSESSTAKTAPSTVLGGTGPDIRSRASSTSAHATSGDPIP
jgi:MFS family permease